MLQRVLNSFGNVSEMKIGYDPEPIKMFTVEILFSYLSKLWRFLFEKNNDALLLNMLISHLRDFDLPIFDSLHLLFNSDLIDWCIIFTITTVLNFDF